MHFDMHATADAKAGHSKEASISRNETSPHVVFCLLAGYRDISNEAGRTTKPASSSRMGLPTQTNAPNLKPAARMEQAPGRTRHIANCDPHKQTPERRYGPTHSYPPSPPTLETCESPPLPMRADPDAHPSTYLPNHFAQGAQPSSFPRKMAARLFFFFKQMRLPIPGCTRGTRAVPQATLAMHPPPTLRAGQSRAFQRKRPTSDR